MFVVLTKDVPGIGSKNTLMKVKSGYFANYLGPQGFAQVATPQMIDRLKDAILAQKAAAEAAAQTRQEMAQSLAGKKITLSAKASAKGTLFKAIPAKDVIAALKKQLGVEIEKSQLEMEHLKKVGEHVITLDLGGQKVELKVVVEGKEE